MNGNNNTQTMLRLSKKIFVTGAVYDLAVLSLVTVRQQVQQSLDSLTQGRVQFQIQQVSDNELELIFQGDFNYPPTIGQDSIYEFDADMITGFGLPGFNLPDRFYIPCNGFSRYFDFCVPISEFLQSYKKSARILKASCVKNIQLDIQPIYIKMRLTF